MNRTARFFLIIMILLAGVPMSSAYAQPPVLPPGCTLGLLDGAIILVCVPPAGWNGDIVLLCQNHEW